MKSFVNKQKEKKLFFHSGGKCNVLDVNGGFSLSRMNKEFWKIENRKTIFHSHGVR